MNRLPSRTAVRCVLSAILVAAAPRPALAAPPGATASRAGDRAFAAGDLDQAISSWSSSLAEVEQPSQSAARLLLNLSTAHELRAETGGREDLVKAREYLSEYAQAIEQVYAQAPERRVQERARRRDRMSRLAAKLGEGEAQATPVEGPVPPQASGSVGPRPGEPLHHEIAEEPVEVRKPRPGLWILSGALIGAGGIGGGIALLSQEDHGSTFTAWSGFALALGLSSVLVGTALIVSGSRKIKYGLHRGTMRGDAKRRSHRTKAATSR